MSENTATLTPTSSTDPDTVGGYVLGREEDYSNIPLEQRPFLFRHMDELEPYPTRSIPHGETVRPLPNGPQFNIEAQIGGRLETIDSFMLRYHTAAMIVVHDGRVRYERYRYGNKQNSRWVMFSVTKSIVSTAVAAAIVDGKIGSLDDQVVKYLPELEGSSYDGVSIRAALNMSSGVERAVDPASIAAMRSAYNSPDPEAVHGYLRSLGRSAPPGTRFQYNDADTFVVGELVARATGTPLATYISKKIWVPAGMEDDAYMRTTAVGQEVSHGGLSATLRDIARFGLLALDQGVVEGRPIVPPGWFEEIAGGDLKLLGDQTGSNDISPGCGYHLQWWVLPRKQDGFDETGGFAALGIFGQQLYVVPSQRLVVAFQSANVVGFDPGLNARGRELAGAITNGLAAETRSK